MEPFNLPSPLELVLEDCLTPRELEIFCLIGRGYEPVEIAKKINLSPKTVSTHRGNILRKTGLENNSQLMFNFFKLGYYKRSGGANENNRYVFSCDPRFVERGKKTKQKPYRKRYSPNSY